MRASRLGHLKDLIALKLCRLLQREDDVFRTAALVRLRSEAAGLDGRARRQKAEDVYK